MKLNLPRFIRLACLLGVSFFVLKPDNASAQILDKLKRKAQKVLEKKDKKTDSTASTNSTTGSANETISDQAIAMEKGEINGDVTLDFDGKSYKTDMNSGSITGNANQKEYGMILDFRLLPTENHPVFCQITIGDSKAFKPGGVYSLKKNTTNTDHPGVGVFNKNHKGVNDFPEIDFSSNDGSVTLTSLVVTGQVAKISGTYEFSGLHYQNNGQGPTKPYSVKGTFRNLTIAYFVGE